MCEKINCSYLVWLKPNFCINVDRFLDDAVILLGPESASSTSCTEEAIFHSTILFWNWGDISMLVMVQ